MASGSSIPSGLAVVSPLSHPITEKLTKNNYSLCKVQVMSAIEGAMLEGVLDGSDVAPTRQIEANQGDKSTKVLNPEYAQ